MTNDARLKALENTLTYLTKRYGDGAIVRLGDATHLNVAVIPTGSLAIDLALGVGGIPRGRVSENEGPESSGKTTLCLHVIAEAQAMGGVCALVDMEHALDPIYAERLGVDVDNLYIPPDTANRRWRSKKRSAALARSTSWSSTAWAALCRAAESRARWASTGLAVRLMTRRCASFRARSSSRHAVSSQPAREKSASCLASRRRPPASKALRFYASVRIDIRRIQAIKFKDEILGNRTRIKVTKNKVAPPFRQAEIDLMYDYGFSKESDVLDLGVESGVIEKRGAFFRYNDEIIGQGRENAKQYLRDNPDFMHDLELQIRDTYNIMPLSHFNGSDEEYAAEEEEYGELVEA